MENKANHGIHGRNQILEQSEREDFGAYREKTISYARRKKQEQEKNRRFLLSTQQSRNGISVQQQMHNMEEIMEGEEEEAYIYFAADSSLDMCHMAADIGRTKEAGEKIKGKKQEKIHTASEDDYVTRMGQKLKCKPESAGDNSRHIRLAEEKTGNTETKRGIRGGEPGRGDRRIGIWEGVYSETGNKEKGHTKTQTLGNRRMKRRAMMQFFIDSINGEPDKTIPAFVKQLTISEARSIGDYLKDAGGRVLLWIAGIIGQVVLSFAAMFMAVLPVLILPILLVSVLLFTIHSAWGYVTGFFDTGDGKGIVTISESDVNLFDKMNEKITALNTEVTSYTSKTRVRKDTEKEYISDSYTVPYPYASQAQKGDLLTVYFTSIADTKDVSEDELLPYMNVNTKTEKDTLNNVFASLCKWGTETTSKRIEEHIVGYEQMEVIQKVFMGYDTETKDIVVPAGSSIYSNGRVSSGNGGRIYVKMDVAASYAEAKQNAASGVNLYKNVIYGVLHTTANSGIPDGAVLYVTYPIGNRKFVIPVQLIQVDRNGKDLIRNNDYLTIYAHSYQNYTKSSEGIKMRSIIQYMYNQGKRGQGYVTCTDLSTRFAYTYTETTYTPVYEERVSYEDNPEKPIYKTYTWYTHQKPLYYKTAEEWYRENANQLSGNQKKVYSELYGLYHGMDY